MDNFWFLQEAPRDWSSSKVMGWDRGALWPAELCTPHQAQLGHGQLKRAMHKAGTLVTQVESACVGKGAAPWRAEARGAPGSCWLHVVPVLGRGRREVVPAVEEQELASEQPHLCPAGSRWPFLAACCLSLAASPLPAGRHPIPCLAWEREARGGLRRGPAPSGPQSVLAEQLASPRLPVSSACLSLC